MVDRDGCNGQGRPGNRQGEGLGLNGLWPRNTQEVAVAVACAFELLPTDDVPGLEARERCALGRALVEYEQVDVPRGGIAEDAHHRPGKLDGPAQVVSGRAHRAGVVIV